MKGIGAVFVCLVALPCEAAAVVPNWDPLPLRPKVGRCVPEEWDGPARADDGRGNSPNTRGLRIDFGTYENEHIPIVGDRVNLVAGVDVCSLTGGAAPVCVPIDHDGLCRAAPEDRSPRCPPVDTLSDALQALPSGSEGGGSASAPWAASAPPGTDWVDAPPDVLFIRVRMVPNSGFPDDDVETALRFGGFCPVPTIVATEMDPQRAVEFPSRGDAIPPGAGHLLISADADAPSPLARHGYLPGEICLRGSQAGYELSAVRAGGDADGDGLANGVEGFADSDADGVFDMYDDDDDNDGIPTSAELQLSGTSDARPVDPRGEGHPLHLDPNVNGNGYLDGSDPDYSLVDGDGTGVPDGAEIDIPLDADGDGLSNVTEQSVLGSNPYNADTDGDGVSDGYEAGPPGGPALDSDSDFIRDIVETDDDDDGVPTAWELVGSGSRGFAGAFIPRDSDGDGTPDFRSPASKTNPTFPTDGKRGRGYTSCVSQRAARFGLEMMQMASDWQRNTVMAQVDPLVQPDIRSNVGGLHACGPVGNSRVRFTSARIPAAG